jgi:hypothetical protein
MAPTHDDAAASRSCFLFVPWWARCFDLAPSDGLYCYRGPR